MRKGYCAEADNTFNRRRGPERRKSNKIELDLADSRLELRYDCKNGRRGIYQVVTFAEARRIAYQMKTRYPNFSCSLYRIWEEKIENWE